MTDDIEIPDDVVSLANIAYVKAEMNGEDAMRAAGRVFVEWERQALKRHIDSNLNNYLCDMRPDQDDSITGFNDAWDVVREVFNARSRKA